MTESLFIFDALDATGNPVTLRFSEGGYKDDYGFYPNRIVQAIKIDIAPNDGGLFTSLFGASSIGDIALANADGGLDYLADYAVDGRAAKVLVINSDGSETVRFSGSISRMSESNNQVIFSLKALQETLTNNHLLDVYVGTNALPAGLEGTADDIKGKVKPKVFGDCRNISPVLVNASLQIYQVSSLDNCVITAVYDDGVRLSNYQINGVHSVGATTIAIDNGTGDIPADSRIIFGNHYTIYSVATGLSGGHIVLSSGLTTAVPDNTPLEVIDFYTDTNALQAAEYFVASDAAIGSKTINITGGVGSISAGDSVMFSSSSEFLPIYSVATGLSGGHIILTDGLIEAIEDGDVVHVIGQSPILWGSYRGYVRLTAKPVGVVTVDAIALNADGTLQKVGDVFKALAVEAGIALIDSGSVAELNSAGVVGLYVDTTTTTLDLLNKVIASVAGFYHFIGSTLYANLLYAPTNAPRFTLEDWQMNTLTRSATGLGSNGIAVHKIHCRYDRIETVQPTVAGSVSSSRRQRLKNQYRELTQIDTAVLARHPLSLSLEIESLLRTSTDSIALLTRLLSVVKGRRDVVTIECNEDDKHPPLPAFLFGDTITIKTPRLGYSNGRNMVIVGYQPDDDNHKTTLKVFG